MAKLVSKTYGDAYLSLAEEKGNLDSVKEEVLSVRRVFSESGELNQMLSHPKIVKEEKCGSWKQHLKAGFLRT